MALNNPGIPQIPGLRTELDGKADFVRLEADPLNGQLSSYEITGALFADGEQTIPISVPINIQNESTYRWSDGTNVLDNGGGQWMLNLNGNSWLSIETIETPPEDCSWTTQGQNNGTPVLDFTAGIEATTGQFALVDDGTNPPAMWKNLGTDDSPDWVEMTDGGGGVSLGETSTTAYRGDRGKTAYDHSQETGNAHDLDASQVRSILGVSTLSGSNTGDQTLPTRTSLGINNVDNVSAADLRARSTHTGTQALSTLSQSGATTNQVPSWNGTAWVPATPSSGSTNASDLTSGTLADARLSSNVPLKNAANTFTQSQTVESLFVNGNQSWIGFNGADNYLGEMTLFRSFGVDTASINGATGAASFKATTVTNLTASGSVSIGTSAKFTEQPYTPSGTTQTIDLNLGNLNTLSLGSTTGNLTLTITVPTSAASGRIKFINHATTPRGITIVLSAGTAVWYSAIPDWASQAVGKKTVLSYTWDGTDMMFQASEAA